MEKEIAEILLEVGAVEINPNEPFTWASGIKSPIYCDNRLTMSDPVGRKKIAEGLAKIIRTITRKRPSSPGQQQLESHMRHG